MKTLKEWLPLAVCIVLGFLIAKAVSPRPEKTWLPELMAEKDKKIEDLKVREKAAADRADSLWSVAQRRIDRDTVFVGKLNNNDKKIKAVIATVDNATKDELRRFVSGY